jgi:Zn-dependent oligopeptidase
LLSGNAGPNGANSESNEFISQNCWTSGCKSKVEEKEIQDLIDGQNGFKLEPWDFYSEQVRKAKYDGRKSSKTVF